MVQPIPVQNLWFPHAWIQLNFASFCLKQITNAWTISLDSNPLKINFLPRVDFFHQKVNLQCSVNLTKNRLSTYRANLIETLINSESISWIHLHLIRRQSVPSIAGGHNSTIFLHPCWSPPETIHYVPTQPPAFMNEPSRIRWNIHKSLYLSFFTLKEGLFSDMELHFGLQTSSLWRKHRRCKRGI